jgi:hypothetical protein
MGPRMRSIFQANAVMTRTARLRMRRYGRRRSLRTERKTN